MTKLEESAGRVGPCALTTFSPIRPERLGALRRRLRLVANTPYASRPLLELSTIQYARWLIISELPDPDGKGVPWRLNWSYLMFEATYDGTQERYLETFADVVPDRLKRLFGTCFGFQSNVLEAAGSDKRLIPPRAFIDYVCKNELALHPGHFRAARDETAAAVRQAIAIERADRRSDGLRGAALRPVQGAIERDALGPPSAPPGLREIVAGPWERRIRPAQSVHPLTLALPLTGDGWRRLEAWRLPRELPSTHFARIVRLPATMQQRLGHSHPDRLERDYVLFSSDFDGKLDSYVDALYKRRDELGPLLEACHVRPDGDDPFAFRDWILAHRIKVQYYLAGIPSRTVDEVRDLIEDRRRIANSLLNGPGAA